MVVRVMISKKIKAMNLIVYMDKINQDVESNLKVVNGVINMLPQFRNINNICNIINSQKGELKYQAKSLMLIPSKLKKTI